MSFIDIFDFILAGATILAQVLAFFLLLFFLVEKKNTFLNFFSERALIFAFFISLLALFFSVFYSKVIGYEACNLCLVQRALMFLDVLLLGFVFLKKKAAAFLLKYGFGIAIAGAAAAIFQYYGSMFDQAALAACGADGLGISSCAKIYFVAFNYITIPMMSLTAFALIAILLLLAMNYKF